MDGREFPVIRLSPAAEAVIARLEENGFEACAVGGCVRDALRGATPHDWDIAAEIEKITRISMCAIK